MHGFANAIDSGVGEFVFGAGSAGKLNIIIARDGSEENFVSLRVNRGNHIDVAAAAVGNRTIGISAANENVERFSHDIDDGVSNFFVNIHGDFDSIENASEAAEVFVIFFEGSFMNSTQENGVGFGVDQVVSEVGEGFDGFNINGNGGL